MKRSIALVAAAALTTIVAMFALISMLSIFAAPTTANQQADAPPTPEEIMVSQPAPEDQPDAQAVNQQIETTVQAREALLQTQVEQRQNALVELDASSRVQMTQLQAQLTGTQVQIEQTTANIEAIQSQAASLQQAIQADDTTYQNEMSKMADAEAQLRQQLETVNAQLNTAYNELAQRQAEAAAAAARWNGSGGDHDDDDDDGNGGSRREHDDDDDHDDHDDDDDDDDHDDDDDGHDDDD